MNDIDIASRLEADVERLTAFPDRTVGSQGHAAAREWIRQRFEALGLVPFKGPDFEMPYVGDGRLSFANVVGVVDSRAGARGVEADTASPLVLGAHYDTVSNTPGADDNAASVAIVLEVARRLKVAPAARPVVIAAFDAEEPPYFLTRAMGSTRFVNDHLGEAVHAAVILDLVAHAVPVPGLEDVLALMGVESHPRLAEIVRAAAVSSLPLITLPNSHMPDMSDHHAFRLTGVPYLFVSCGQGPHYHAPTDTLDNLDLRKAVRVVDVVETLVRTAAESELDGARNHDSSALDHELLNAAVGPAMMRQLGIDSAADMHSGLSRLVELLQVSRLGVR